MLVNKQMLFQKLFLLVPSPVQDSVYTDSPPLMPPADGTPEGALVMRWPLAKNWYDFTGETHWMASLVQLVFLL